MRSRRAFRVSVAVALTVGVLAPAVVASPAEAKQARLREAIKTLLVVKAETNKGYEREKFPHWIDGDGDCQDTRSEVLRQESKVDVTGDCTVTTGEWYSYYDGETWTDASDVDIDHLVPLHEAWGSGAKRWTKGTRKRFANDLRDRRALVAVTDNVNQSKGAGDPAEWLPTGKKRKCKYIRQWVPVKLRWNLTVNRPEKRELRRVARGCANKAIRWRPAKIVGKSSSGGGDGGGGSITGGIRFTKILYNPDGNETYAPNGEKVYIKNVSGSKKNLKGVTLKDDDGHRYKMPRYRLRAGRTVIVHSGSGSNGAGHLYAGWDTAVWNNDGDKAALKSSGGKVIDRCVYAGGGVTASC